MSFYHFSFVLWRVALFEILTFDGNDSLKKEKKEKKERKKERERERVRKKETKRERGEGDIDPVSFCMKNIFLWPSVIQKTTQRLKPRDAFLYQVFFDVWIKAVAQVVYKNLTG